MVAAKITMVAGEDNNGSATAPPTPDNSGNSPAATIDNTPTSPPACPDGSAPVSNGMCPSPTASLPLSPAIDCNATPDDPTCPTTTTPTEQNFAPNTLTQPRCPLLPTDANDNCQGVDMQGVDSGLPPRLGLPQQQAHYELHQNAT